MRICGISLGSKRGDFEVIGVANVATQQVKFQAVLNGTPYFESEDYEDAREVMMEGVRINTENKSAAN
jgi:hypothetical protein